MNVRLALAAVALPALLAACGGSSAAPTITGISSCIVDATTAVAIQKPGAFEPSDAAVADLRRPDLDYIAQTAASAGAFRWRGLTVTIALGGSGGAPSAKDLEAAYRPFVADPSLLERRGAAVIAWDRTPDPTFRSIVDRCAS